MRPAARSSFAVWVIRSWVLGSAFLNLLGWLLAWSGYLNTQGYLVGLLVGGILFVLWTRGEIACGLHGVSWQGWSRRWKRPLPFVYGLVLMLVAAGAVFHPPNNYDALTYRIPQILHWLAEGRWHWIPVSDDLINISPPGYGWLMAPAIALLQTDRLFALPNVVAFALLPGLSFSVLRSCGVRRRVAGCWMWLLPSASSLAMQAGGMGNDMLPAVYALAAIALGFRAARRSDVRDFWLSVLAAALLTGVKVTAAPLVLPWLIAVLPCWRLARKHWVGTVIAVVLAGIISYLPTAVSNLRQTGSWNGDPHNQFKVQVQSPARALVGNSLMILTGALEPPVCPAVNVVKARFRAFDQTKLGTWIREDFQRFGLNWGELATEEASGLGLGLFVLAVLSLAAGVLSGAEKPCREMPDWGRWVGLATGVAVSAYLLKMGSESAARLTAPYLPLLFLPVLRARGQSWLTRQGWWRLLAVLVGLSIVPALILTPARPLWPAQSMLAQLATRQPDSAAIARARLVYDVYDHRSDDVAPLKPLFPRDGRAIGYVRLGNDIEAPLWKPYGSHRVVEVLPPAPSPQIAGLAGSVVVGASAAFGEKFALTPEDFASSVGGKIVGRASIAVKASAGPQEWVVIQLP